MRARRVPGFAFVVAATCVACGPGLVPPRPDVVRHDAAEAWVPDQWMQPTCAQGQTQRCTCTGGALGEQVCGSDATYGACGCADGGLGDASWCPPGDLTPCACAGGLPGTQTCDGVEYGPCVCVMDAGAD